MAITRFDRWSLSVKAIYHQFTALGMVLQFHSRNSGIAAHRDHKAANVLSKHPAPHGGPPLAGSRSGMALGPVDCMERSITSAQLSVTGLYTQSPMSSSIVALSSIALPKAESRMPPLR